MKNFILLLSLFVTVSTLAQTYIDKPFVQDYADKFEFKNDFNTNLLIVSDDRNEVVKILSSEGLLQPYEKNLVADIQYRPLTDMKIISLDNYQDQFVYLTDVAVLSNAWAGKFHVTHGIKDPTQFVIGNNFETLIASQNELALFKDGKKIWSKTENNLTPLELLFDEKGERFLILTSDAVYLLQSNGSKFSKIFEADNLTAITIYKKNIILGTTDGLLSLDGKTFKAGQIDQKLPWTEITALKNIDGSLWIGSSKGVFKLRDDGKYDYYASKRWLLDDEVIDISKGPEKSVLILTKTGLSKINFIQMTLAEKADHFQKIQRLRHVRYGFTSATSLEVPGDLSTTVLGDTDNDGLWTSMYLAGELFRYAVTKSEDAKLNAYEAFEAMERLTAISGIDGFPARTYELDGYQSSDTDPNLPEDKKIWRIADKEDARYRWKSTTSSDESCGHFFVYALFAKIAPDKEWRDRAIHQIKIEMDHIMDNDWYLVTWNGEPTEWGRWNPDYVNSFPTNVGDRRLNSTLILAFLQTTYHFTGDEKYKKAANKLIKKYGYDENANRPASAIGYVKGERLSSTWNHSDDEMYFLTIPAFVNYSFTEEQKEKHFAAVKSHWEAERSEKNPLWNYLFALAGGKDIDVEDSAWWLREFPMDLIDWKVDNSHRKDLTKLEPNFRNQAYSEVLPQDERVLGLHNGAYRNNGGSDGRREYDPYIYLLPYWAGRYVDAISAPESK
jgi:hypothetical protein